MSLTPLYYMVTLPHPTAHYCSLLLTTAHYCSLQPPTAHYCSLLLTTAHYCSLLPPTAHYCSLQLTTAHYSSLQPPTAHYSSLLLTTAPYSSLQVYACAVRRPLVPRGSGLRLPGLPGSQGEAEDHHGDDRPSRRRQRQPHHVDHEVGHLGLRERERERERLCVLRS